MKASDLTLSDVFDFDESGGVLTFGGERVLLLDAVAMGLLRKQLVESFGMSGARSILTRFGYSHGWRCAEAMRSAIHWDSPREWRVAGGRLHRLYGMVSFEPVAPEEARPHLFAEGVWRDSYEADQHLLHFGRADECVCWTLVGFASGFLSHVNGQTIYCIEDQCRARGDALCRMVGRFRDEWPAEFRDDIAFYELEGLGSVMRHVRDSLQSFERKLRKRRRLEPASAGPEFVMRSLVMREVVTKAKRVALLDTPVLVSGEPGVGKERLARFIHRNSPRQAGPLVSVHCGAVPPQALEEELFGALHSRLSGMGSERAGAFELARTGVVMLDDVSELPLRLQARVVKVLQDGAVRRLGEARSRHVDVRLIAVTSTDLRAAVSAGRFRPELWHRLRAVELDVPALRERREDVLPLARAALAAAAQREGRVTRTVSAAAARQLLGYGWPGNVRELVHAMDEASAIARGRAIEVSDLPAPVLQRLPPVRAASRTRTLADVEREHILGVLEATGGNRAHAAKRLGIGLATLFRRLEAYRREGHRVVPA